MKKRYITKQGRIVPVMISAAPILDPAGQPLYFVGHVEDIRDRLKVERMKNEFMLFMVVVVDSVEPPQIKFETGKIAGFDFGLKTFLTCSEGFKIESPLFLKQSLNAIKKASRQHSRKVKGSNNREQARLNLARKHEDIANRRSDWFWKLAHQLTSQFDVLCFETLNLRECLQINIAKVFTKSS